MLVADRDDSSFRSERDKRWNEWFGVFLDTYLAGRNLVARYKAYETLYFQRRNTALRVCIVIVVAGMSLSS